VGVRWAHHAYQAGLRFLEQHPGDRVTIFSTFPPLGCHLAAWWLARRKGIPWIADFRDPLVGNPIHEILPWRARQTYEFVQRTLNASAGAFIANTDEAERLMKQKHRSRASRVHLIWNGFDPEQRVMPLPLPSRPFKLVSHVGELYESRTAVPLLESFSRLIDSGQISPERVRVELTGPMEEGCLPPTPFREAAEAQGWLKLKLGQVPKEEALQIAQTSDALLLIQPQSAIQVPGKLFEYLQIGRPILALVPRRSSVERVLEKSGVPYRCVYSGSSPDEFDRAVLEFLQLPSDPIRPSAWFEETFNAEAQTAALTRIIEQL
jgi:glycosyltransferase involved in cell wall biosynthesis